MNDPTAWQELDLKHCWHPYTQHGLDSDPLPVVGAKDSWLELADGRKMLDAISSWWCCLHGHSHPALVEALTKQAQTLDHVLFAGCTHEPAAELASMLVKRAPPGLTRVFYSDNGSTAVEVALKAAYAKRMRRGHEDRATFIALEGGYHGDTVGAMSVGDPDPFFENFQHMLFDVERVPPNADALTEFVEKREGNAAAIILEPTVQGANGMTDVPDDVLWTARQLCNRYDMMLIADEVFTGFGRTGTFFACDRAKVSPDALCLSKGLTSGMMPLAATLFREDVFETFVSDKREQMFFHGHTFTANPLACALALASLELMERDDTVNKLASIGSRIASSFSDLKEDSRVALRHMGNIVAIEVLAEDAGYLSDVGERLRKAAHTLSPDVLLRPMGNVIYAVPPASTTETECDLIARRMREIVDSCWNPA